MSKEANNELSIEELLAKDTRNHITDLFWLYSILVYHNFDFAIKWWVRCKARNGTNWW